MDYEFWFYMLLTFVIGLALGNKPLIYIGNDEAKFNKAWIGLHISKKKY